MILLPKYKELRLDNPIIHRVGMSGQYRFVLSDLMGRTVYETDWSDNVILDQGLDQIGSSSSVHSYNAIGDDNTAASPTQTALGGYLASTLTGSAGAGSSEFGGSPDYEFSSIVGSRHIAGAGTGTIRETGQHIQGNPGVGGLYNRHVISPEIPKGVDQNLDVWWKHTYFPYLTDVDGPQLVLDGVTYDTKTRACDVAQTLSSLAYGRIQSVGGSNDFRVYDGPLGALTDFGPTGNTTTDKGSNVLATYVNGNHYQHEDIFMDLDDAALPGPLRCLRWRWSTGPVAHQFTAVDGPDIGGGIPKDETTILELGIRTAWARR